jgi:hypothetical protein
MVKISESATFNRNTLLRLKADADVNESLDLAMKLDFPGENYALAAYAVWFAMRAQAVRTACDHMDGDDNRDGYILSGMSVPQVIELLWPDMRQADMSRTKQGILSVLKKFSNAVTLERNGFGFLWWVADEWRGELKVPNRRAIQPPSQYKGRGSTRVPEPAPKSVDDVSEPDVTLMEQTFAKTECLNGTIEVDQASKLAIGVSPYRGELPMAKWEYDLLHSPEALLSTRVLEWATEVASMERKISELQRENDDLRTRLASIANAIAGTSK